VGRGLANIVAGLCGSLPGSGGEEPPPRWFNIPAGGRTALSGNLRALDPRPDDLARSGLPALPRDSTGRAGGESVFTGGGSHRRLGGFPAPVPQLSPKGALTQTYLVVGAFHRARSDP